MTYDLSAADEPFLRSLHRTICGVSTLVFLISLAACSGNSSPSAPASVTSGPTGPTGPTSSAGPTATEIVISPATGTLAVGQKLQFTAQATESNGVSENLTGLVWSVSNPSVAAVNPSGVVTGVSPGTSTLSAVLNGVTSNTVSITVQQPIAAIQITPLAATIPITKTQQFTAVAVDASGKPVEGISFSWTSSNPAVASIDQAGLAVGLAAGSVTITSSGDGLKASPASLSVQAAPPVVKIAATPTAGPAPLAVHFDGSGSTDPNGPIASYSWTFGDGATATGPTADHTYAAAGSFNVTLTIGDQSGGTGSGGLAIAVSPQGVSRGWVLSTVPGDLEGVNFVDVKTGWVVGLSMGIFKTTDGGSTWNAQNNIVWKGPTPAVPPNVYDVFFLDQDHGWAAGWPELILATQDGGQTWVEQHLNRSFTDPTTYCSSFASDGTCGIYNGSYLRRIRFADPNNGFAVGRFGYVFKTTDGGATWNLMPQNWPNLLPDCVIPAAGATYHFTVYAPHLFGLDMLSANEVFVVGGDAGSIDCPNWENVIAHTTDGGDTWVFQYDLDRQRRFMDIHFIQDTGWAVGEGGMIMKSTDHGRSWVSANATRSITSSDLLGLAFPTLNTIWAVGSSGTIIYSGDGGQTFANQNSQTTLRLQRVWFTDILTGWAAGHLGVVPRTATGGQ